jgi:hypothetical protein
LVYTPAAYRIELRVGDSEVVSAYVVAGVQAYKALPWHIVNERAAALESGRRRPLLIEP